MISGNENDHYSLNFKPKIAKMRQLLNSWKCRRLSLKGKITVVNSLAISKLIYLCNTIYTPKQVYTEVKEAVTNFIWDGKNAKIAYSTLINDIHEGGLKLVDLETKVKSLHIAWTGRLCSNIKVRWKIIPGIVFETNNLSFYFSCNRGKITHGHGNTNFLFYRELQFIWSKITEVNGHITIESIRNQVLWNNRYITIENNSVQWNTWFNAGIVKINDILDNRGTFLSSNELNTIDGLRTNFLETLQIKQAVPFSWRQKLLENNTQYKIYTEPLCPFNENVKPISKVTSKSAYIQLRASNSHFPITILKWNRLYPNINMEQWANILTRPYKISRETTMQSFQYNITNRNIRCRKKLHERQVVDSPNCIFCREVDFLCHFFFSCPQVRIFWNAIYSWLKDIFDLQLIPEEHIILLGMDGLDDTSLAINYILLVAKQIIHDKRVNDTQNYSMAHLKAILKYKLIYEKIICDKTKPILFRKFDPIYNALTQQ